MGWLEVVIGGDQPSRFRRMLLLLGFIGAGCVFAGDRPVQVPDPETGLERVHAGQQGAYRSVVDEFDAAIRAAPDDPVRTVSKCRFISQFTDEDYDLVAGAPADFEACIRAAEARWPRDPSVLLLGLDQVWGDEAIEQGERLILEADAWSPTLRRQLLTKVSEAYDAQKEAGVRGGELAVMAAKLGETSRVASAVTHLIESGKQVQAQQLLRNAAAAATTWEARQRVTAALALQDRNAARAELRRYEDAGIEVDAVVAAKAHLRAGDIPAARKLLDIPASTPALKGIRFEAALAAGDMQAAAAQISLNDSADFPMAMQRAALVANQSPTALWSGTMLMMLLVMGMVLAVMALAPALVLLPVHYRGMVRRVRGRPAVPLFDGINLRHAWLGAAVAICVPTLVALVVAPGSVAALLGAEQLPDKQALLQVALWGAVAGLLLLLPCMRKMGGRTLFGDRVVWRGWWRVLLAWAILIAVSLAVTAWNRNAGDTSTTQTKMIETLVGGGFQQYGLVATLLLMAVLVPFYEELVFRGLLLGGMTAHISFGWANLIQAVLFAVVHGDSPRFVFYLALGLLTGWLTRKSRSLGPGIALHGANNALATMLRFAGAG